MRRATVCLSLACLALALAACSSAPIHFYTLLPPADASSTVTTAPYAIAVLPVSIPAQVDRPELVVRQGGSRVALLEGQRWIGPLGDEIRSALATDLTRQLGAQDVYGMGAPEATPVYRVTVDVKRFESVPSQYTLLVATWDVDAANGKTSATPCTVHIKESVGPGYAALAAGHQRGLEELATMIAAGVHGVAQGNVIRCHGAAG